MTAEPGQSATVCFPELRQDTSLPPVLDHPGPPCQRRGQLDFSGSVFRGGASQLILYRLATREPGLLLDPNRRRPGPSSGGVDCRP
ncbi:MAG: hypothetical protein KIT87_02980 [Anaerolineae bacterium]|nr:hypothetical protein [Anaerolineae bacterium]